MNTKKFGKTFKKLEEFGKNILKKATKTFSRTLSSKNNIF